jgi:hypothetical protein
VAAIAFLGAAVLIKQFSPASRAPDAHAAPPAASAAAAVPSVGQTAEPTASASADPPSLDPNVSPLPTSAVVPVAAGRVELVPVGSTNANAIMTVALPDGWGEADQEMYLKPDRGGPIGISIAAYKVEHVNMFPCRWSSGQFTDTAYPHTAAGLAQALSAFWGQDPNQTPFFSNSALAPIATKPAPATLGGYPAWRLQILIPSTFDFSACDGGQLVLWETVAGSGRVGLGSGEIDRIWVVDVHGELVVVDAALPLLASKTQETELQAVIDSVAFPR